MEPSECNVDCSKFLQITVFNCCHSNSFTSEVQTGFMNFRDITEKQVLWKAYSHIARTNNPAFVSAMTRARIRVLFVNSSFSNKRVTVRAPRWRACGMDVSKGLGK